MKSIEFLNDFIDLPANSKNVLFFRTEWARKCEAMQSVVEEMEKMFPSLLFHAVDAEKLPELSSQFAVKVVPCFVALTGGDKEPFARVDGAKPAELLELCKRFASTTPGEDLDAKCARLINSNTLMLFIKGTPEAPRCGFTGQLIRLLGEAGLTSFGYYNILEDEAVRQRLKELSQWPTYPQIYWKGELIGGLDILKEMKESGELAKLRE